MDYILKKVYIYLKHQTEKNNRVANALSQRSTLFTVLQTEIVGLAELKGLYATNCEFTNVFNILFVMNFPFKMASSRRTTSYVSQALFLYHNLSKNYMAMV